MRWHWRCDCGAYGNGPRIDAASMVMAHVRKRPDCNARIWFWPRGHRDRGSWVRVETVTVGGLPPPPADVWVDVS